MLYAHIPAEIDQINHDPGCHAQRQRIDDACRMYSIGNDEDSQKHQKRNEQNCDSDIV